MNADLDVVLTNPVLQAYAPASSDADPSSRGSSDPPTAGGAPPAPTTSSPSHHFPFESEVLARVEQVFIQRLRDQYANHQDQIAHLLQVFAQTKEQLHENRQNAVTPQFVEEIVAGCRSTAERVAAESSQNRAVAAQELVAVQSSVSDCFNEIATLRNSFEGNLADMGNALNLSLQAHGERLGEVCRGEVM